MKSKKYSKIFVTHLPSFYKINLYNQIAGYTQIHVCFISEGSIIRTEDFSPLEKAKFSYEIIFEGSFESRNFLLAILRAFKLLRYRTDSFVIGGWDLIEFWILRMFARNVELALESSIYESKYTGFSGFLKKQFLRGISRVYASGTPHIELLSALSYTGDVRKTLGVGIINEYNLFITERQEKVKMNLIYVGRMSQEKNLDILLNVVSTDDRFILDCVGDGPLLSYYQERYGSLAHINFLGYQNNQRAVELMCNSDVFVLSSKSEPWGLVVEEAINVNLIPVVSSSVGCAVDLVEANNLGLSFESDSPESLKKMLILIHQDEQLRLELYNNVRDFSISDKDKSQVECFI